MEYSIPKEIATQVETNDLGIDEESMGHMLNSAINSIQKSETESQQDPIEYLKKIMKTKGLRNKDLKAYIGSSGSVCSVLKKRRPLTLPMIRNLHKHLHIPAEILIQPYKCL